MLPNIASAAISYDTGANSVNSVSDSSTSVTITAAEASEKALIWVSHLTGLGSVSTVTVGGVAATLAGPEITISASHTLSLYYFDNPPTSATVYNTTISAGGGFARMWVELYKGVATGAFDSVANNTATQNVTITTTVVGANAWLAAMVTAEGASATPTGGTGTTIRHSENQQASGDSNGTVGTGSQSLVFNTTQAAMVIGGYMVSMLPAPAVSSVAKILGLVKAYFLW